MHDEGLKRAVEEFLRKKHCREARFALMYDIDTHDIFNDIVFDKDLSYNCDFKSESIVNLGDLICEDYMGGSWPSCEITVENVCRYLQWKFRIELT